MRVGICPRVTGDIWHELMVWDMVVGTRGQKAARVSQRMPECGQAQQRVSAGCTRCHTRVMISNVRADSEHAVGTWQVYLDGLTGCGVNEYVLFFCAEIKCALVCLH